MTDLKQTIIEYMKDFHVEADMQGDENSTQLVDKVYNKSGICVNKNPISLSDDEPIKG